jgi:hypothetical protein
MIVHRIFKLYLKALESITHRPNAGTVVPLRLRALRHRRPSWSPTAEASVHDRREAFRALLGNRRVRVGPDPERGFRVAFQGRVDEA